MEAFDYKNIDLSPSCFSALGEYFGESQLEQLGREVRFIERSTSRLSAWMFLQLNTCMIQNGKSTSLNDMASGLSDKFGIRITKQSLDERFNIYGVKLMRKCYESAFERVLGSLTASSGPSCGFERIILRDSTSFQLPDGLSAFYQGNSGDTTGSVIKIQHEYDLLSGKVLRLDFRDGKENDNGWLKQKGFEVSANDLHLMDLGYYKCEHLAKIEKAGGYFVSRYKVGTTLLEKDGEDNFVEVDWGQMLAKVEGGCREQTVYIDVGKQKTQVRIHFTKMPNNVVQGRLLKYDRKEKNHSKKQRQYTTSALKKQLASYNIFITNAKPGQLSGEQIYLFYRLRWQIELLFKIWKSIFEIDEIGKMGIGRFECYLYGKLIGILIGGHIQALFNTFMEGKAEFELSEWKAYKLIKKS